MQVHMGSVSKLRLSPDGSKLISAGIDGSIIILSFKNYES